MRCFDLVSKYRSGLILFAVLAVLIVLCSCTDYERSGMNPRPFNEPVHWENNPYGDVFRN